MKKALKFDCITCAVSIALTGCSQSNNSASTPVATEQKQQVKTYNAKTFFDTTSIMGSSKKGFSVIGFYLLFLLSCHRGRG